MSFLWYSNVRYKYAMRPYLCQVDSISSRLHCVTRLAESIASSEQLRRDVDEQAREKSVWKRSSERWYDAYQREREERARAHVGVDGKLTN